MRRDVYWSARAAGPGVRRWLAAVAGGALVGAQAGCGLIGGPTTFQPQSITVTSPVFEHGRIIPSRYTCHGAGVSPPLHWSDARPPGTKALALIVDDADAPITPYIYWIVFDINPATTDLSGGQLPPGARQAENSTGHARYDAPCPHNQRHFYRFTVYALDTVLSLPNGTSLKSAWMAIARASIARGRLTGMAET